MKKMFLAFVALLSFTFIAAAADVSGKYTYEMQGRNGAQPASLTLKADGAKLEGTVSGRQGQPDTPITDGKVEGDKVTFTVVRNFNGNEMKTTYTGVVKGDTIDFTTEGGRGPQTFTAKKAQ